MSTREMYEDECRATAERCELLNRRLALIHEVLTMSASRSPASAASWLATAVRNIVDGSLDHLEPAAYDHPEYPKPADA